MFNIFTETINQAPDIDNAARYPTFQAFFSGIANLIIGVSLGLAIISIAYSGIQFILSTGDAKKLDQAQRTLIWGVVAAVVTVLAFAIKAAIINAAGIQQAEIVNDIPNL